MMTQAFYTGISGIRGNQYAIDVVSNNMANISTVGYRGAEYEFASLFEESLAGAGTSTVGLGSKLQATSMKGGQGILQLTDRSTDLAILGDGWFGTLGEDDPVYTRDGSFTFDENDDLVSLDGFHVLGTLANNINEDGILTNKVDSLPLGNVGEQEKLRFPKTLSYPPEATTTVRYEGNLGNDDEIRIMGAGIVDIENNKNNLNYLLLWTQTNL